MDAVKKVKEKIKKIESNTDDSPPPLIEFKNANKIYGVDQYTEDFVNVAVHLYVNYSFMDNFRVRETKHSAGKVFSWEDKVDGVTRCYLHTGDVSLQAVRQIFLNHFSDWLSVRR